MSGEIQRSRADRNNHTRSSQKVTVQTLMPERLERVLYAVHPEGGSALLLGEAGSGKNRLAEEAAYALQEFLETETFVMTLPSPFLENNELDPLFEKHLLQHFGVSFAEDDPLAPLAAATELSALLIEKIQNLADGRASIVVAPSIDGYPPRASALLGAMVRSRTIRTICTARQLAGAADRVSRDPRVKRMSIGPLSYEEATVMLTQLLRCDQIEFSTLHRWCTITNGYAHTLTVLVLALERHGLIVRDRGTVWEKMEGLGTIPEEFLLYLEETCTAEELTTFETIVLAEPLAEQVLLEKLLPEHLRFLQSRGLVISRMQEDGGTALTTSHELLARALKARMSPERRKAVSQDLFLTLRHDFEGQDPKRLARLVTLGLEAGRMLPVEWLMIALSSPAMERDPERTLSIGLALVRHPEAYGSRLAEATISICHTARLLGNQSAIAEAAVIIRELVDTPEAIQACTQSQRIRLRLELVTHLTLDLEQYEDALAIFSELDAEEHDTESPAAEMVRCARAAFYARTGQLRKALEIAPAIDEEGSMQVEWVRSQLRLLSSLVLSQQGRFLDAAVSAEKAHTLAVLGNRSERFIADELTLAIFFAQWASGATTAANETMFRLQDLALTRIQDTGFVEAAFAAIALSEGKWRKAAQRAKRALERFALNDPFGIATLITGILAYAQAAQGERSESRRSIMSAEIQQPGTSQVLRGIVRILTLEARLWNGEADLVDHAHKIIAWANAEELPFIELRAMQVLATAQGSLDAPRLTRARHLASVIDEPMSSALLGYLEEITSGESKWDSPFARMLSDLGIWMPLPRNPLLSAREREIALHAALGYSSRWIAERFFLSTRTVETHLRHVFTKLGVTGRDELRNMLRDGKLSA